MALIERQLGQFSDAQEPPQYATIFYSYDDQSLLLTAVRVDNQTNQPCFVEAKRIDGTRTYSETWQAGEHRSIAIGTQQANRLQLTVTPSGKLDGVEWSARLI
jgi:hypothetical protein